MVQMSDEKTKIRISVIIPFFNAEHYLSECFEAIQAQTFTDFELILVNDGSQDHSLDVCKAFQAQQPDMVKVLDGQKSGISAARNRGLDAASGEWIAFCDADDLPDANWLKILYDNAVQDKADLSCCAFQDIGAFNQLTRMNFPVEGKILLDSIEEIHSKFLIPLFRGDHSVHGYLFAALFRRDIIEQHHIRFNPDVILKEDELFFMDYLLHTRRITAEAVSLYQFIRRDKNATARHEIASDYIRELNWMCYTETRLAIFRKSGLAKTYPEWESEFALRVYAHMIQLVCCDPGRKFDARMQGLQIIAMKIRQEKIIPRTREGKTLLFLLFYLPFLLPWACKWKRAKGLKKG